jgi:uncharacterized protein YhbP (UPF0306 family)
MKITRHFGHEKYSDKELQDSISTILSANNTLALSTVKNDSGYINTAHYGFDEDLQIYIITGKDTQHTINASYHPQVAVAIWNKPQTPGEHLEGLQLFGEYSLVEEEEIQKALDAYTANMVGFSEKFKTKEDVEKVGITFYKIAVGSLKLIDEPRFGRRNFISLVVM